MTTALQEQNLFSLDRASLEKWLITHYQKTNDANYLIEAAVAVLVKNAFNKQDFSFIAKDLVRTIFLTRNDLQFVRQHCIHFREYFNKDEWCTLIARLFKSPEKFLDLTELSRSRTEYLHPLLHSGCQEVTKRLDVSFVYEGQRVVGKDIMGKFKTPESADLLFVLSTLKLFAGKDLNQLTKIL
ncbi:hypothetical protein JZO70_07895 [Enterococcus sp. 669A]|uniref:Uncharacterized protein n=1 Tax=Candidatus Enterococcus moelleringii TaxID=2815325 RepID=A0ABS3LCE7_9ENTE|nr:hypothetical protein [Enterococcus sp. 669A]MBO1306079.1 hypothetical protein [Enterococcus sp. 669A]